MNISKTLTATLATLTLGLTLVSTTLPAAAAPIPCHPRVNQVNERFQDQRARIQQGLRNGTMTRGEAHQLRNQGAAIKSEERTMRAEDGGHLTRADDRMLNQQLNFRSKEIYVDKH